jgi:hypothetical protein
MDKTVCQREMTGLDGRVGLDLDAGNQNDTISLGSCAHLADSWSIQQQPLIYRTEYNLMRPILGHRL